MMSRVLRFAADRARCLAVIAAASVALAACTKCDVPTPWQRGDAGSAPLACHSDAPAQ
jgi:hypothetical protein